MDPSPHNDEYMTIGELASHANVTVRTLQYYDQQGLLTPTATDQNNHRLYSQSDVEELYHILILKFLGLTLSEIKERRSGLDDVASIRRLANSQLQATEKSISDLLKTMTQLRELIEYASSTMGAGKVDWQRLAGFLETKQDEPEMFWRLISIQDDATDGSPDAPDQVARRERIDRWHGLIAQTIKLMEGDVEPSSERTLEVLARHGGLLSASEGDGGSMPDFLLVGSQDATGMTGDSFEELRLNVGAYLQAALDAHGEALREMAAEEAEPQRPDSE